MHRAWDIVPSTRRGKRAFVSLTGKLVITPLLIFLTGCAQVTIQKGGSGKGYDVFRPEPYLLVFKEATTTTGSAEKQPQSTKDKPGTGAKDKASGQSDSGDGSGSGAGGGGGKSGSDAGVEGLNGPGVTLIWLPNYSERYRVRSTAFLAKAGSQFTIRDGWMLTGVTDQSDNTALITAAAGLLSSAIGTASGTASQAAKTGAKEITGQATSVKTQTVELYKFLFDPDGNFYGLAKISLAQEDLMDLDAIRKKSDNDKKTIPQLQPLRAPTFDGRKLEDRTTRATDSKKDP